MKRSAPLARRSELRRGGSLKRSPMRRKRSKGQPPERRDDAFLAFVRRQPCCKCKRRGPSHPHHPRTGAGVGIKSPDGGTIPLCADCHRELHALSGRFRGWTRVLVRAFEQAQNGAVRELYERRAA